MIHEIKYFLRNIDQMAFAIGFFYGVVIVLLIFLAIPHADAAKYDSDTLAIGDQIISNTDMGYITSNHDVDNMRLSAGQVVKEGSMGSQLISGVGSSTGLSKNTALDSTNMQSVKSDTLFQATGGGVGWETNYMRTDRNARPDVICDSAGQIQMGINGTGNTPLHDAAEYYSYVDGQAFTFDNSRSIEQSDPAVIDDTNPDKLVNNLSVTGVEGLYATGGYYFTASTQASGVKTLPGDPNELNLDMFVNEHEMATGKDTALEFSNNKSWQSFGDAFGFEVPVNSSANETNSTGMSNITNSSPIGA